jgi:hypothetical protein
MVTVLAFSLQDQVEKYGAYVGIAAFLGLAVLSLLYFAQARELKRLRDWAGRAPERAQELEARVVAQAEEARRAAAAPEPARTGAVGPARPIEQPTAVTPAPSGNGRQAGRPAPVPMGPRPAIAAAAAVAPAVQMGPRPALATARAATMAGAASVPAPAEGEAPSPAPLPVESPGEPAEGGNGEIPPAAIPRATPRPQAPPRPAPAAPLRSTASRSTTLPPRRGGRPSAAGGTGSNAARIAVGAVLGVLVLAGGAFAATQILGGDDEPTAPPNRTTNQTGTESRGAGARAVAARPDTVVVLLNGTPVEGLASDNRERLIQEGYSDQDGMIRTDNNTDQQRQDSVVLFKSGERRQAEDVAAILDIERIERIDPDTQALADLTDDTGRNLAADVTAIIGADKAP